MENLLQVTGLKTYYHSKSGIVPAVDGVNLTLHKGEILGIVGESGCGKSTVARSIIGLLDKTYTEIAGGKAMFHGMDLLAMNAKEMNRVRGEKISMIFQNPLTSLNPVYTVENQIAEALRIHGMHDKKSIHARCLELMQLVGIPAPEERLKDFPHQLSGGMQQRVLIAIALACNPEILIADEPTTALDVTIQAQILELMRSIRDQLSMSMILITHNMGVVAEMCDRVMVMYGGVVMEEGTVSQIFLHPQHPYTQGLLAAIPSIEVNKETLFTIEGTVPRFHYPVTQCRFASRCSRRCDHCTAAEPPIVEVEPGHLVRCIFAGKENA